MIGYSSGIGYPYSQLNGGEPRKFSELLRISARKIRLSKETQYPGGDYEVPYTKCTAEKFIKMVFFGIPSDASEPASFR